jgi:uncharacterized protein
MSGTNESVRSTGTSTLEEAPRERRRSAGNPVAWLAGVVAILVIVIVAAAGVAFGRSSKSDPATITVTGSGTVQGVPDTVNFTVGIHTTESSAAAALAVNDRQVAALERTLEQYNVPTKDLQTSGLSIFQQTNQNGVVTGFTVDDTLNVTVTSSVKGANALSEKAGRVIDAAATRAGNGIDFGGVTFSISNDSAYLASARTQAMRNAMTEASGLASGANRTVTGIMRVTDQETSVAPPTPYPFYAAVDATRSGVPIQIGQQPVNVQVTVVYTLS